MKKEIKGVMYTPGWEQIPLWNKMFIYLFCYLDSCCQYLLGANGFPDMETWWGWWAAPPAAPDSCCTPVALGAGRWF